MIRSTKTNAELQFSKEGKTATKSSKLTKFYILNQDKTTVVEYSRYPLFLVFLSVTLTASYKLWYTVLSSFPSMEENQSEILKASSPKLFKFETNQNTEE